MMPKYFPMTKQSNHQSALGQYGQGGGGHGHDWPRAEGGDGVFPPVVVPLLTGGTPPWRGPLCEQGDVHRRKYTVPLPLPWSSRGRDHRHLARTDPTQTDG